MLMEDRVKNIIEEFSRFEGWEERYKYLIGLGKDLKPMNEDKKTEDNKVRGCQSQVWLYPEWVEGKIHFTADSDAAIAKGIVALLVRVYSEASPEDILSTRPNFVEEIGLKQHLSMNRANGLASMLKQISLYAVAFQAKEKMGLL